MDASRRDRALWLAFAALTVLDVASWHSLLRAWQPAGNAISKAVFIYARDEHGQPTSHITARATAWSYTMLPQPAFSDENALTVPPGYPVMARTAEGGATEMRVELYEARSPLLLQVRSAGTSAPFETLLVDESGTATREPMLDTPPPMARLQTLLTCFSAQEPVVFHVRQGAQLQVEAGRCRWDLPVVTAELALSSADSSMLIQRVAGAPLAETRWRWWLLVLVALASVVHRLALRTPAWVGTDATAVVVVFAASWLTPLWIALWAVKGAAGCALLAATVVMKARVSPRWRAGALTGVVGGGALLWVGPQGFAELNTRFNHWNASGNMPGSSTAPASGTTHLVLGYSTVNGAALDEGGYGKGALDGVLQEVCGGPGITYARHAVDGANHCFIADTWSQVARGLPTTRQRIFVGGFNDDLTAPATRLSIWLGTLLAFVPSRALPRPHDTWAACSVANLEAPRRAELLSCVERVAAEGPPLVHVYDVASFDLGHARRFGRDAWLAERRAAVEKRGGIFVDGRELMPGESPVLFNDMVHPSEVGYRVMMNELCRRLPR
ncbi:MAG: hypothetical protein AB2A00_26455 [Myxococcota bacterium]